MSLDDRAARRRAATDFTTNLVVLAGAGTGKTSLLVERVLSAVGSGALSMERLAAITYTEKAAGEMRERIAIGFERLRQLARGEDAQDAGSGGEADRAYAWLTGEAGLERERIARTALEALEQLDRGAVSTIHGFCASLLREFPIEAGVDPGFAVDAGEHAERLLVEGWEAFLLRELGPEAPRPELWRALLERSTPNELKKIAWGLADAGIPAALVADPARAVAAPEAIRARARALADRVDTVLARQEGLSPVPRAFLDSARRALRELGEHGLDGFLATVEQDPGFAARLEKSAPPDANVKLRGVSPEEMDDLLGAVHKLGRKLLEVDEGRAALAVEAVAPFALGFRESYLRAGFVSFDGLLVLARDLLRDHPDVRERVKQRFAALLVDEFQDTDPVQYEIVLLLGEMRGQSAPSAFEARLEPGRLFIVGDVKQSIYRFRHADYTACRSVIERIEAEGGVTLALTENFRSVPGIIEPVNQLFADRDGPWTPSPFQPAYLPIVAHRAATEGETPAVELWTVFCKGEGRDIADRREAEGRAIAEAILRLAGAKERRIGYRDVTILLRAFTDIASYLRPLREYGIPFVVDGGREFLARPEVEQLLATFRTVSGPSDEPALLAFLRSPAGGVSDVELAGYAMDRGPWRWATAEPDPRHFPAIARAFRQLRDLRDETLHLPADAVVRRIMERTYMLPLGAAAYEGAQQVANLQKLAAAAGELAADGRLSLDEVVDALVAGRLEDIHADRPLADDRAEAVRITSIHRMKGLENRYIFLPGLSSPRQTHHPDPPAVALTLLPDGGQGLGIGTGKLLSSCRVHHDLEELQHNRAEELRVLYVALTRARERLILITRDDGQKGARVNDLAAWGYSVGGGKTAEAPPEDGERLARGSVLHRRIEPVARTRPRLVDPLPETTAALERYDEAVSLLRAQGASVVRAPSEHEPEELPGHTLRHARSRDLRQAIGHAVHRVMETWIGDTDEPSEVALRAAAAEAAREHAVEARDVERGAREILVGFRRGELWPIFTGREILGRELPMLCEIDGETWHGSIDLVYRDDDGSLVVADYKTDEAADDAVLRQRYGHQLAVYARAVERALELSTPPRAELWLLRSGRRLRT